MYCFTKSSSETLGSVTQNMSSLQNLKPSDSSPPKSSITPITSILYQKPFRFLCGFVAKNCQQVHGIHAEIVVMMQLDTCINS